MEDCGFFSIKSSSINFKSYIILSPFDEISSIQNFLSLLKDQLHIPEEITSERIILLIYYFLNPTMEIGPLLLGSRSISKIRIEVNTRHFKYVFDSNNNINKLRIL